jgi:hypothetical protein
MDDFDRDPVQRAGAKGRNEAGEGPSKVGSEGDLGDSGGYPDSEGSPYPSPHRDPSQQADTWLTDSAPPPRPRSRMEPSSGWLREIDFVGDGRPPPDEPMVRQVNVRLDRDQYRDLCEAADLYGVAPTTMGRMLLRRGTRAVLDERRRDDFLHGGRD